MIISKEMIHQLKVMKQEILDLKQTKKASCASKYYIKTISQPSTMAVKITYKSGAQPIITEAITDAATAFSTPSGNIQYMCTFSQYASNIILFSTREIEKVEEV